MDRDRGPDCGNQFNSQLYFILMHRLIFSFETDCTDTCINIKKANLKTSETVLIKVNQYIANELKWELCKSYIITKMCMTKNQEHTDWRH